ncbi:hypothetical protein SAMN04487958_101534 [Vreelandella subterranea]|uniref:tRNA A-37 threonylcarbamoyl transferase component Bud32 n=1 Tax=Vreelandella subterranea TaxID=416874 RepID=A0A1H9Q521_9GAMM|nr:hypothetical protein [Halomonas subterranea]SER55215.1 hypothetical protein SAMN04487958_101534 [Halomonas subterranea]
MYDSFLFETYPHQQASIASYTLDEKKVWLKKASKRNSRLAYLPLNLFAKLLRVEALKPVPNLGGRQSITNESKRIKALSKAGVAVPEILAESSDAILIADVGNTESSSKTLLDQLLSTQQAEEISHYLTMGVQALNDVHARQCYLSEAFARNIIVAQESIVFIDFETDPGSYHTPINCMVRDWYCFIFSLYGKLSKRETHCEQLTLALLAGLNQAQPQVRESFLASLSRLKQLERVPFHHFGSDGRKIAITLDALSTLDQQLRTT